MSCPALGPLYSHGDWGQGEDAQHVAIKRAHSFSNYARTSSQPKTHQKPNTHRHTRHKFGTCVCVLWPTNQKQKVGLYHCRCLPSVTQRFATSRTERRTTLVRCFFVMLTYLRGLCVYRVHAKVCICIISFCNAIYAKRWLQETQHTNNKPQLLCHYTTNAQRPTWDATKTIKTIAFAS